jgi:hypothetical protein
LEQASELALYIPMTRQVSSDLAKIGRSIDLSGPYHIAVVIYDRTSIRTCKHALQASPEI